jgi:hypothetical protein
MQLARLEKTLASPTELGVCSRLDWLPEAVQSGGSQVIAPPAEHRTKSLRRAASERVLGGADRGSGGLGGGGSFLQDEGLMKSAFAAKGTPKTPVGGNHISVVQLDTVAERGDADDDTAYIIYGFDLRIYDTSIHQIRMRYSKARHFYELLEEASVLKHFKPKLEFPPRHVFWDNVKDPNSITQRWEELRAYFERLLNQPEVLACPLVYDELGLSETTILKVCTGTSAWHTHTRQLTGACAQACLKKSQETLESPSMARQWGADPPALRLGTDSTADSVSSGGGAASAGEFDTAVESDGGSVGDVRAAVVSSEHKE